MKAINASRGVAVAECGRHARSLWDRSRGLLGRKGLQPGEGLLIEPCSGIHTFGMAFPIDAIFLDKKRTVVHLVRDMKPQRMSRYLFGARSVLEVSAGTIEGTGTRLGDQIAVEG